MERRGAFDYILLETSGLADPGNIAPLFWVDEGLGSSIYLDGIVTLVDASNIVRCLDEKNSPGLSSQNDRLDPNGLHITTAHSQVSYADVVVLNKSDTVPREELNKICERIQAINGLAKVHITEHSRVSKLEGVILDLHAYHRVEFVDISQLGHTHIDPVSSHASGAFKLPAKHHRHSLYQVSG